MVADVAVFNRALDPWEIQSIYKDGFPATTVFDSEKVCAIESVLSPGEFIQLFESRDAALGKGLRLWDCPNLPVTQWRACRVGSGDVVVLENVSATGKFMQVE